MAGKLELLVVLVACLALDTYSKDSPPPSPPSTAPPVVDDATVSSSPNFTESGNGSSTTPSPTSTTAPDPCAEEPCGKGIACEPFGTSYMCLCLPGDAYNSTNKSCERAKIFPGNLVLKSITFEPEMSSKGSAAFTRVVENITATMKTVFKEGDGYSTITVLELLPVGAARFWKEGVQGDQGVNASVEMIFDLDARIQTAVILERLNASNDPLLAGSTFGSTSLCDKNPCEEMSIKCNQADGLIHCICRTHYITHNRSWRTCKACPLDETSVDSRTCIKCGFGYSGLNCTESWKLWLVIVGSVLGILLLITLILLPVVALKSSKKSSKKNKNQDIGKPYVSHYLPQSTTNNGNNGLAYGPGPGGSVDFQAGRPKIPRATTTSSWDNRSNLEMLPGSSQQNLIPMDRNSRLYDEDISPYTQSRPQSNLHAQARPRNNPYAQNRPQNNPYAQSQGQTNPYYVHDN